MPDYEDSGSVLKVLSLEDSVKDFDLIKEYLEEQAEKIEMVRVVTEIDFTNALRNNHFDIILADFKLPTFNAFGALDIYKQICPDVPFICVTGAVGEETAIELFRQGAVDFVMKDKLDRLPFIVNRALRETAEKLAHRRSEAALIHSHGLMRYIIEHSRNAIAVLDNDLKYIYVSQRYIDDYNILEKDIIGKFHYDILPDLAPHIKEVHKRALKGEVLGEEEDAFYRAEGSVTWTRWECRPWFEADGFIGGIILSTEIITERKNAEIEANLAAQILSLLNSDMPLDETIRLIIALIKKETGIAAAGIRLKKGSDYPYTCQIGFTDDFLKTENSLLTIGETGSVINDDEGKPALSCICGLVISGKSNSLLPFFTTNGTFWTNDSRTLHFPSSRENVMFNPRYRCVHDGYLSMAIIPIRAGNDNIGLLQLNHTRKDKFTPAKIQFFESISQMIGVAFSRKLAREELQKSHELLFKLSEQIPGVIYQFRLYPDGSSCFPYASSGISMIYEVSPEEVHEDATPAFGRLHPDDSQRVTDLILESARSLNHFYCEFRVILPRQGLKWRSSVAVPEILEDNSVLWHGIIYDITEIKEMEQVLITKIDEFQRFQNLTVNRELTMIALKKEVNGLLKNLGQEEKYIIVD